MMDAPLLAVENLVVRYGGIEALKGVSVTVPRGSVTAIIGANGAGKSTLLLTISGVLKPAAGTIRFKDESIAGLAPHRVAGLGVIHVPEGRRIFASLTVRENLLLGAYRRNDRAGIAADLERACDLFPILKERLHQPGGTLSGGEQQMLAIARGILAKPELLLIDELSLGLAPIVVEKLFRTIGTIRDSGATVLLVDQNATLALRHSDRAFVLEVGRIVREGASADLLADPKVLDHYLGGM